MRWQRESHSSIISAGDSVDYRVVRLWESRYEVQRRETRPLGEWVTISLAPFKTQREAKIRASLDARRGA
jgi:hypothetical protein